MSIPTFTSSVLSPHERGVEFGEHFADQVSATVAAYRRLFVRRAGGGDFDVDAWADRAWQAILDVAPAQEDEIAGIAAGAGVPVRDVASINARTEILVAADPTGQGECSTVVALPPDGAPVAVQTWDWYDAMAPHWLHWTIPHPDGRIVQTVTEFGMLAKIGVSSTGVGVMLNMLHHENDAKAAAEEKVGYPVHLLSRAILDSGQSLADALAITEAASTTASTSLTVADRAGAAASIELFPGGPGVLEPTDGLLVRTNHFVSETGRDGCIAAAIGPSSRVRRDHLLAALTGRVPRDADAVLAAMHHHDPDGGVCRHSDPDQDPVLRHGTLATVVLDVDRATLTARRGGPCGAGVS
ncbi:MAG TPA: C45 family peptidase [Nocardioidaceae bacterium]|nr:C45 family peptidase [Nocardioidaceae bacterium]